MKTKKLTLTLMDIRIILKALMFLAENLKNRARTETGEDRDRTLLKANIILEVAEAVNEHND